MLKRVKVWQPNSVLGSCVYVALSASINQTDALFCLSLPNASLPLAHWGIKLVSGDA